jgi:hypothetical protein
MHTNRVPLDGNFITATGYVGDHHHRLFPDLEAVAPHHLDHLMRRRKNKKSGGHVCVSPCDPMGNGKNNDYMCYPGTQWAMGGIYSIFAYLSTQWAIGEITTMCVLPCEPMGENDGSVCGRTHTNARHTHAQPHEHARARAPTHATRTTYIEQQQ